MSVIATLLAPRVRRRSERLGRDLVGPQSRAILRRSTRLRIVRSGWSGEARERSTAAGSANQRAELTAVIPIGSFAATRAVLWCGCDPRAAGVPSACQADRRGV